MSQAAPVDPRPPRKVDRVQSDGPRVKGLVKWFSDKKGIGFISPVSGPDVFVHFSGIEGSGHRTLVEGQEVEFAIETGEKGQFAVGVTVVKDRV